jgi:hypothetical protein
MLPNVENITFISFSSRFSAFPSNTIDGKGLDDESYNPASNLKIGISLPPHP